MATIQRALAIPTKRHSRPLVGFLSREEVQAIISAPDPSTRAGQRDQALLATLYNTGARVSEAINIKIADLALGASPSVRLHGKGRKDRAVPIWPATALRLRRWLMRIERAQDHPLFPASSGGPLTRSAVTDRLRRAVQAARGQCASLTRNVSRHIPSGTRPQCTCCNLALISQSLLSGLVMKVLPRPTSPTSI